ncbi:MAG TPA: alpha/beta hydrolase [Blastocatellia bacterium]|nr:alpha/beta hydrolase [Blastocatellia bacterium]
MQKVNSKDGAKIAFDKTGQGPAVILVDGALCYRSFGPMPKLAPLLAPNFTVYFYDRRGRGDSGDAKPYAVEREIEDLEALIKEAGGSACVLGLSSGAALALKAAAQGLNIKKLALYEPPFMVAQNGHRPPADHQAQLNNLIAADRRGDAVSFFMTKMVGAPAIFAFIMRLLPVWSKLKAVAHTLPHDAAIMGDFSLPTRLVASINVPTLVMGGGKSPANLRQAVQAVADTLPGARLRTLEGQTHNASMKVLAPILREFFSG